MSKELKEPMGEQVVRMRINNNELKGDELTDTIDKYEVKKIISIKNNKVHRGKMEDEMRKYKVSDKFKISESVDKGFGKIRI